MLEDVSHGEAQQVSLEDYPNPQVVGKYGCHPNWSSKGYYAHFKCTYNYDA